MIVNADALQVYACWRVLSARPSPQDEAAAPHALFGHVPCDVAYSTGAWLRDVAPILAGDQRPIIVGGTGLNFAALTEGLAPIPGVPDKVRAKADGLSLAMMLRDLPDEDRTRIDTNNRARVQRAWEVLHATGRSLTAWQAETPPPLLPLENTLPLLIEADPSWLQTRIETRFDQMIAGGALDEARAQLEGWDPKRPASRAIGAAELIAHLRGEMTLTEAREAAVIATRQYAKRQRTWFRNRMKAWTKIDARTP